MQFSKKNALLLNKQILEYLSYFEQIGLNEIDKEIFLKYFQKDTFQKNIFITENNQKTATKKINSNFVEPTALDTKTVEEKSVIFKDIQSFQDLNKILLQCADVNLKAKPILCERVNNSTVLAIVTGWPTHLDVSSKLSISPDRMGLLYKMIENVLELTPQDVYITSALKCEQEDGQIRKDCLSECLNYLKKELAIVNPKVILAFGSVPAQMLTNSKRALGILRASTHTIPGLDNIPLRITYSLTEIVEQPALKKDVWIDLMSIKNYLAKSGVIK